MCLYQIFKVGASLKGIVIRKLLRQYYEGTAQAYLKHNMAQHKPTSETVVRECCGQTSYMVGEQL